MISQVTTVKLKLAAVTLNTLFIFIFVYIFVKESHMPAELWTKMTTKWSSEIGRRLRGKPRITP